jgi:uncharacterized protein (UPF0248 family)
MKKKFELWVPQSPTLKKIIMELKIAILIILIGISNAIATPTYSQVTKVSLDMKNTTLENIMDEIERQSEFYFIFNQKQIDVNRVVDVQADRELITDILPRLFDGTNVNFAILDKKILPFDCLLRMRLLNRVPIDNKTILFHFHETAP